MSRLWSVMFVFGIAVASCGRVSEDVPGARADAGNDSGTSGRDPSLDADAPRDGASDASPCDPADAGALTRAQIFEADSGIPSNEPESLVVCGQGLCLLGSDGALLKLTHEGAPIWSRQLGGRSSSDHFSGTSMASDANGNLIVGGDCEGQLVLAARDGGDRLVDCSGPHPQVMVLRFDASGLFVSSDALGFSESFPPRVAAEPDGRHVVAAHLGGDPGDPARAVVVAWGADGAPVFRYSFIGLLSDPSGLAFDTEGNAVVAGFFLGDKSHGGDDAGSGTAFDPSGSDICAFKLSPLGELVWSRCFGGSSQVALEPQLALGPDNSVFLAGTFAGDLDFGAVGKDAPASPTRLSSGDLANSDIYVAKLTAEGDFAWQRQFGNASEQAADYGIATTPEGGLLLLATTRSALDIGDFHIAGSPASDFIAEFDTNGQPSLVTELGVSLGAHNGVVVGACRDFYIASSYEGVLLVPGMSGGRGIHGGVVLLAGRY